MPELPDIELYLARLRERLVGEHLETIVFHNPFVLRSFDPAPSIVFGRKVISVSRIGKRIVLEFEENLFVVIHLMIAGRLQWQSPAPPLKRATGKMQLASFRFSPGQLTLNEGSTKKRAAVYIVQGKAALAEHNRGGLDVLHAAPEAFREHLTRSNRTLKRALTDPRSFDGIGNAYSDEILFEASLSPMRLTGSLTEEENARLLEAARSVLSFWSEKLLAIVPGFPKPSEVTAFRPEFNVHGRFNQPCRICGSPIQHIVYAENETNYCAHCQNEGRLLADRSLSRLLKADWPKTLEEMLGDK